FEIRSLWIAEDSRRDSFETIVLCKTDTEIRIWWEGLSDQQRDELYPLPSESPMHRITRELQEAP
ncbi:MAG: hypothetical protein WAN25_18350, partial [Candidatus Acidiferrum sp.]